MGADPSRLVEGLNHTGRLKELASQSPHETHIRAYATE
jgi:hypothetical protein